MKVAFLFTAGRGNPYVGLLEQALIDSGCEIVPYRFFQLLSSAIDVLHFHWPESVLKEKRGNALLGFLKVFIVLIVARAKSVPTVWTVHNLGNHEPSHPLLERFFLWMLSLSVDGWISLSEEAVGRASTALPSLRDKPVFVVPHGHYRDAYPALTSQRRAREALQVPVDAGVFLFFGQIRPYKNLSELIGAFERIKSPNVRLLIAGQDKSGEGADIRENSDDRRLILRLERIPDEDVPVFFAAADLCVLPFAGVLNSGSAILSLSMNTPVLVPDGAPFEDLRRDAGPEWVRTYKGRLSPADLESHIQRLRGVGESPNLDFMEWEHIGRATATAYESLVQRRKARKGSGR